MNTAQSRNYLFAASAVAAVAVSTAAAAQVKSFDIPAQNAESGVLAFGRQADVQIAAPRKFTRGRMTSAVSGQMTVEAALDKLLAGSGLIARKTGQQTFTIIPARKMSDAATIPAAPAADAGDTFNEAIVVTASRREESLQNVPLSVAVIRPDNFTSAGLVQLREIIDYTPGYNFTNKFGRPGGGGTLTARGVGQQGGTPVVGVYIDDVPLSNNGPYANGEFSYDGMLGDIERVEFLKGPQGTLYGTTSIGGAVKYVTRRPSLNALEAKAGLNVSMTAGDGLNQVYNARVSVPVVTEWLAVAVAGFREDNGGFVDYVSAIDGAMLQRNVDGYDKYGLSADVYAMLSDRLSFRARAMRQQVDASAFSRVTLDVNTLRPSFGRLDSTIAPGDTRLTNIYYSGTLSYELDGATITSVTSQVRDRLKLNTDLTALLGPVADFLSGNAPGSTSAVALDELGSSEKFVQEIRMMSLQNDVFEWIFGLYYTDEKTRRNQTIHASPVDFTLLDSRQPSKYREYAAYGNLTYYFNPDLDITVGARISGSRMRVVSSALGPFGGGDRPAGKVSSTVDTWLFSARYRPSIDLSLYVRAASGYRAAPANLPLVDPINHTTIEPFVRPDTLWSYEAGAKGDALGGRVSYDLSVWHTEWNNFLANVIFNGFAVAGNASKGVTASGAEASFTLRPIDGLTLTPSASYARSKLKADEPTLDGLKGQQVPSVPKWTASALARYEFMVSPQAKAFVGGGIRYVGKTRSDFSDTGAFLPGISDPAAGPFDSAFNITTNAYSAVDFNVGADFGAGSLTLYVTNLTNKHAYANAYGRNVDGTLEATGVPIRPRTIGLSLSVNY